jgi:hypothetical protein
MTGDRNYPLLNASKAEWPGIKVLTCWPHIAWKGSHENMRILVNKDQMPRCVADLRRLADCRSQAMFDAVGKFILRLLTVLPEVAYATWLNNQYLTPPWNVWFRTVSGIPGVQPSSQPQESYHKSIKKHSGIRLRAATDVVLDITLPQILAVHSGKGLAPSRQIHYPSTVQTLRV